MRRAHKNGIATAGARALRAAGLALGLASAVVPAPPAAAATVRLKDLTTVQGMRDNVLLGYGLVVGLAGTGDSERVFFTVQSLGSMLNRIGVRIDPRLVRVRNVAAVSVTARLPTQTRPGALLDVTVSSLGDARALTGGVLLQTPLLGPDGNPYALAQGPVEVGGYDLTAGASSVRKNPTTTGRVPGGATVERAVLVPFARGPLVLQLKTPDFTNAARIAAAVNLALGAGSARALDAAAVEVALAEGAAADPVGALARIETIEIEADERARVVVNERTGTVVAGARVRLRPVAIAHGELKVTVRATPVISQPPPYSPGRTVSRSAAELEAAEQARAAVALPAAATVEDLVRALNLLGTSPRDLIAILQAIKAAGAMDADLEVM